jgi:hypothetical protein
MRNIFTTALLVVTVLGVAAALFLPTKTSAPALPGAPRKTGAGASVERRNSLKQMGIHLALFESKFKKYPQTTSELRSRLEVPPEQLKCPECGQEYRFLPGKSGHYKPQGGNEYAWTGGISDGAPPDLPMALCENCAQKSDKFDVLFFQGRVDVFDKSSPMGQQILEFAGRQKDR